MKYFGSISLLVACFAFLSSSNVLVHGMPDAATTSASTPTASKESHSHTGNVIHDMLHGTSKSDTGKKDIINAMATHSTFAGTLKPVLKKLRLNKEEGVVLLNSLSKSVHWEDLVLILTVGWLSVPFLEIPYSKLPAQDHPPFRHTYLYMAADHLQQGARIALAVYAVDVIKMFCVGVGLDFCSMGHFPHAFAQTAYVVWLANRVAYLKKYLLRRYVSRHPDTFGRVQIVNRFADAMIGGVTLFFILNILKLEMGVAFSGILAFGSVGTLAFGLASKDLTTNILNGLMLSASDRIYEGDSVKFGDGHSGTIISLGWLETVLRGSDEVMVSIPNGNLLKQQVSNLSRVRFCQVKQTLRFKYKDADKLPVLLEAIKEEIRLACPTLITDGTRPFRVHWTEFADDHLTVVVDTHFRLKPIGTDYWDNRQRVLQAIDRAVKKVGLTFADLAV